MKRELIVVFALLVLGACAKEEDVLLEDNTVINYKEVTNIVTNGDISMNELATFIENCIDTQPIMFVDLANNIVVCTDEEYLKYPISDTSTAFSNPDDMSVYVRISVDKATITHELAHIFDYVKGYHYYSNSDEFISLYNKHKLTFSFINDVDNIHSDEDMEKYDKYFNDNIEEYFAGVVELYFNHSTYLKEKCYEIYVYLDKIL